jgi:hypothetical protein
MRRQTTYRWITDAGETVYSGQPPLPGTRFEEMKAGARDGSEALLYAMCFAVENIPSPCIPQPTAKATTSMRAASSTNVASRSRKK